MKSQYKVVIIGSGPTGLGAAYRLKELGDNDFLVIEKENQAGGLASSFLDDKGFTWDVGGHIQFSHYKYFDQLMQAAMGTDGWFHHQRESWAWLENRFVPYPVQNNVRYLTKESLWKCMDGLVAANQEASVSQRPKNFREWILATFGTGLAEIFMIPYNLKVWAYPPETMAYHWIGDRVAVTDLKRVMKNVLSSHDDVSWGPNNTFRFPKKGGTGQIWRNVAQSLGPDRVQFNAAIKEVNWEEKRVVYQDGRQVAYELLLSTMPVDRLCRIMTPSIPASVLEASQSLVHSTSNIVGLGIKGQTPDALRTKCWMYFPEPNCPYYRATVFSNYSPSNVPDPNRFWSLMTETSESPSKPVNRSRLIEDTIQGCLNTRLIASRDDVVSTWMYTAEYGYPTPTLDRDSHLEKVHPFLEQRGIYSRGRFGAWKYEVSNQDHSVMQGVEWVNKIRLGEPETTLVSPEVVNAGVGR